MANEEIREENIKKVLNCAIECFKSHGLEATTVTMVAKQVGLTTRSLQRYFGNKNNLVMQAMALLLNQSYIEIKNSFESKDFLSKTGFEQIIEILKIRAEHVKKHFEVTINLTELEVYFSKNNLNLEIFRKYMGGSGYVDIALSKSLDLALKDSSIRSDIDKIAAIDVLSTTYKGLLQRVAFLYNNKELKSEVSPDRLIDSFIKVITSYLKS